MPSIRKASGTGRRSLRAEMFAKASRSLALVMRVPPAGSNPTGVAFFFPWESYFFMAPSRFSVSLSWAGLFL